MIERFVSRSKAKDKNPAIEKVPFFDFGVLKSRTVQILITGTAIAAVGVSSPMILFVSIYHFSIKVEQSLA